MSLTVNSNTSSLNSLRNLQNNTLSLNQSLQRLSSGFRINRGSDDPSGLIISEQLRGQLSGIKAAQRVVGETTNFFNTAEAAMDEVSRMLVDIRGLATAAVNGATTADQRKALNFAFKNAVDSIDRIFAKTNYAGDAIFANNSRTFQLGEKTGDTIKFTFKDVTAGNMTMTVNGTSLNFSKFTILMNAASSTLLTAGVASRAIDRIEDSIKNISLYRGAIGAISKNTLQSQQRYLGIYMENLTASESYIRDTNMAQETSTFTRNQILVQASTAVLAQANTVSQNVLQLLG